MPPAIEPIIKQRVIAQYLQGVSRDRISTDNDIGTGTVSNIIDEWKRAVQDSDYESIGELAIHCKKEGISLADLTSSLRIRNYIKQIDPDQERVELFIADVQIHKSHKSSLDVLEKIGNIGLDVRLEELEEHIKHKQAEKERLQHEIDEARAVMHSLNVDRQIIEDYKELKNEMDKYHLKDPKMCYGI